MVFLAIHSAGATGCLHRSGVGQAAQVHRDKAGIVDQAGDDCLRFGVVTAQDHHNPIGARASRSFGLKPGGQRVESLDQPRARHSGLIALGGRLSPEIVKTAGDELIGGIKDDLACQRPGLGEHPSGVATDPPGADDPDLHGWSPCSQVIS